MIIINVSVIILYYYKQLVPDTLIWIYWWQSVIIGFFNFLLILNTKQIIPGSIVVNGSPIDNSKQSRRFSALFFLFHYNFFHLAYLVFLVVITTHQPGAAKLIKTSIGLFFLSSLFGYFQTRKESNQYQTDLGRLFFIPYVRIIPMHCAVLLPAFFHLSRFDIFIVLKFIADIGMYLLINYSGKKKLAVTEPID